MKSLTIVYVTSRKEPHYEWFFESLFSQCQDSDRPRVIVVDTLANARAGFMVENGSLPDLSRTYFTTRHVLPKPTIWQGGNRLTNTDWWAKSNALNTGICLCQTEWIAFCDDRTVLVPEWLDCIKMAMQENYAVCGNYAKHAHIKVENGIVTDYGAFLGGDNRTQADRPYRTKDWYGGSGALPLEWCLRVNGFSEDICDSLGMEDSVFGMNLRNNDYPIFYDTKMKIIEDRTPGEIEGALKRADKGVSPNDKSHRIIEIFEGQKTSLNSFDIRKMRESVLAGNPFPYPTASGQDWYDGEFVRDMK